MKRKLQIITFFIIACGFCAVAKAMEEGQRKKDVIVSVDKRGPERKLSSSRSEKVDDVADGPSFLTEGDFERIKKEPEGCELCMCNAGCGVAMLGIILALTFCK